jgi:chloramphenicol O-acetyltransferase type A
MTFEPIDLSTWNRKEYFEYYFREVPCNFSMTLNLDLTTLLPAIKKQGIKLYPIMVYLISAAVNKHKPFRTAFDTKGVLGVYDILHPFYTLFQKESETFTNLWTEFTPRFSTFYEKYLLDVQTYGQVKRLVAKPDEPPNVFTISSCPWTSFTSLHLNLPKSMDYLLPIFTLGKYFEQAGKIQLPLAIQVHHAVCDGFHVAQFVNDLQEAMNTDGVNLNNLLD